MRARQKSFTLGHFYFLDDQYDYDDENSRREELSATGNDMNLVHAGDYGPFLRAAMSCLETKNANTERCYPGLSSS